MTAMDTVADYKVRLEHFYGPLDLLLHLVRENEVEIAEIPIAVIAHQYVQYVEAMQELDINLAGEFLVMASTLMEIKSRMLLPRPEEGEEEELDPRLDLVRKLLEYKRFKELAQAFVPLADRQGLRWARPALPPPPPENPDEVEVDLSLFDLAAAFGRVAQQTLLDVPASVFFDDVPIEEVMTALLEKLAASGPSRFADLVGDRTNRMRVVAGFLAVLELARQKRIKVDQESEFGEIRLTLAEGAPPPEAPAPGTDPGNVLRNSD